MQFKRVGNCIKVMMYKPKSYDTAKKRGMIMTLPGSISATTFDLSEKLTEYLGKLKESVEESDRELHRRITNEIKIYIIDCKKAQHKQDRDRIPDIIRGLREIIDGGYEPYNGTEILEELKKFQSALRKIGIKPAQKSKKAGGEDSSNPYIYHDVDTAAFFGPVKS